MAPNESEPSDYGSVHTLPSKSPTKRHIPALRGFALKFHKAQQAWEQGAKPSVGSSLQSQSFRRQPFFFYGSLMDPWTLMKVLHLKERPLLRKAEVFGYRCMLWGDYPALLDDISSANVYGVAFEVQSLEQVELLQNYETKRYRKHVCRICLEDGSEVIGWTFMWDSDIGELSDGSFDLKDYQMKKLEMNLITENA